MKNRVHFTQLVVRYSAWLFMTLSLALGMQARAEGVPTSNAVMSVDPAALPGGKVVLRVGMKEALKSTPSGFSVGNPPRIALDLTDTGNGLGKNTIEANLGPLTSVNVIQAGNRTRLVLNLNRSVEYEAKLDGKYLIISLGSNSAATAAPVNASAQFAEAAPAAAHHAIRDIDFRRGPNGEGRIVTTLADAQTGINIRQQAKGITVDFIDTELPKALQRRLDVADFATPVRIVESYALGDSTRMVIEPQGGWEYSAYQTDNQFVVEVKPSSDGEKKTPDGKIKYTGEKLSLNFQNVEVRSVLQVIADFTGLNIVASDTVNGNLTLRLKDVPWDQALDLILQTKGLDKRVNGNIIWIAPKDELLAKEKLEFEAKSAIAELEPLVTEYIPLNYLRADEAQALLYGFTGGSSSQGATSGKATCSTQAEGVGGTAGTQSSQQSQGQSNQSILSKRGRATYELKTNTLIINDTAKKIDEVRQLLAKLDVPARQVMIEARIVLADESFSRQLGARLGVGIGGTFRVGNSSQNGIGLGSTLGNSQTIANPLNNGGSSAIGPSFSNVNLPAPVTSSNLSPATLGLTLLNVGSGNLISLELQAMEADLQGKVLSNPRVVTSNQKPAVILQGTQIPYTTLQVASGIPTYTVTFKDALLCLLVDPQILNNDSIVMTVEIQKDTEGALVVVPGGGSVPGIDTKRVKTQVRVKNGETAVLGGVYETVTRDDYNKVPFLGDLPFLGNLFKNNNKETAKTELLIFLTPRILDDRMSLR
ncbi:MAG: type IV pilus secretin PilQ [Thiobacillaceae bacterium]